MASATQLKPNTGLRETGRAIQTLHEILITYSTHGSTVVRCTKRYCTYRYVNIGVAEGDHTVLLMYICTIQMNRAPETESLEGLTVIEDSARWKTEDNEQ